MQFYDDKPKTCDCGCTVYPGEKFFTYDFKVINPAAKKVERIHVTSCSYEAHMGKVLYEALEGYEESEYIYTADDYEADYGDMKYHQMKDGD